MRMQELHPQILYVDKFQDLVYDTTVSHTVRVLTRQQAADQRLL